MSASGTDASDFLRGNSVAWGSLGITMFVSALLAWFNGLAEFVFAVVTGPRRFIYGTLAFVREVAISIFTIPITAISEGFGAAAAELPVVGGPFEFAFGVGFVIIWFWLLGVVLDRLEVI